MYYLFALLLINNFNFINVGTYIISYHKSQRHLVCFILIIRVLQRNKEVTRWQQLVTS